MKGKRDSLLLAAYLNLAMCHIKLEKFLTVKENCEKALALDSKSEKAYFRRGTVSLQLFPSQGHFATVVRQTRFLTLHLALFHFISALQASAHLQDFDDAIKDFNQVLEIDPNNKAAKNQITICQHKIKKLKEAEKKMYAGMFAKFAEMDAKVRTHLLTVEGGHLA